MVYLQPSEYEGFGLGAETADALVATAGALMEAHCRRPSLLAASYTERTRLRAGGRPCVRLSYGPLAADALTAVRVRYAGGGVGAGCEIAQVFGLAGGWGAVDVLQCDVDLHTREASEGPVYGLRFAAESDEWMLDRLGSVGGGERLQQTSGALLAGLLPEAVVPAQFVTVPTSDTRTVGVFAAGAASAWSARAGAAAGAGYAGYRALGGALTLEALPGAVHAWSVADGSLRENCLQLSEAREPVNDVTLTGEMEATTWWTEVFRGDGLTSAFTLTGDPAGLRGDGAVLIDESFTGSTLDGRVWTAADSGSHLSLTADGLTVNGGNGLDGQTTLAAAAALELGGAVVLELRGVKLGPGSAGVLCGLYGGAIRAGNCVAGFSVSQAGGQTLLLPLIAGVQASGSGFVVEDGHRYTLRLRVFCAERLRVKQTFYTRRDAVVTEYGGGLVEAPLRLVLEARDEGHSSNTPVTVLYDGEVASSPVQATVVVLNSVQLFGAIGLVRMVRAGSAWIESTDGQTGASRTRLIGAADEGVDCSLAGGGTGTVTFFDGRIPAAGEIVSVLYRSRGRAVARVADPVDAAAEGGVAQFTGHLRQPVARSSEDCENAAAAVLGVSTDRGSAVRARYVAVNPEGGDVLPGDLLTLQRAGGTASVLVRKVTVEDHAAAPEALRYTLECANDWASPLGITLSEEIAADANLPAASLGLVPGSAPGEPSTVPVHVLANLRQMTVTAVTGSVLTLDAGLDPPVGGGFEVRRRDGGWGSGSAGTVSGDLVLRSPVRGFDVPRAGFEERFFVRMFDGSVPRVYSRWSSAVVTHVGVS